MYSKQCDDARPYLRTVPSVLTRLANQAKDHNPSVVHKTAVAAAEDLTYLHRNYKQVKNLRERVTASTRLSRDGLANLHDMAYDIPAFVCTIQTFPDLIVIAGRDDLLQQLNSLLLTPSRTHTQLLSYDTTFNFGDFYISALLFRAVCFHENPVIPALFMVHERKLHSTHEKFVDVLAEKLPALQASHCVLVTDGEAAVGVFEDKFPKMTKVFCWNHVFSSAKQWLRSHNASSGDLQVYVDHIRTLLHAPTPAAYRDLYQQQCKLWSQSFKDYYDAEIGVHYGRSLGRVVLERLSIYDPNSGVTQNMSEGFNTVMRRMHEWKEATLDVCFLTVYQLQTFYMNNIRLGCCNRGDYRLISDEFTEMQVDGMCSRPL